MPKVNAALEAADAWLRWLIIAGIVTYFAEITRGTSAGNIEHSVYWWVQSFVAVCFTIEYILRWVDDAQDHYRWHYPHSALGIIDLISILPFWIGCFLHSIFCRSFEPYGCSGCSSSSDTRARSNSSLWDSIGHCLPYAPCVLACL